MPTILELKCRLIHFFNAFSNALLCNKAFENNLIFSLTSKLMCYEHERYEKDIDNERFLFKASNMNSAK